MDDTISDLTPTTTFLEDVFVTGQSDDLLQDRINKLLRHIPDCGKQLHENNAILPKIHQIAYLQRGI